MLKQQPILSRVFFQSLSFLLIFLFSLVLFGCGGVKLQQGVLPSPTPVPDPVTPPPPLPPVKRLIAYTIPSRGDSGTVIIYSFTKEGEALCNVGSNHRYELTEVKGTFDKAKFTELITAANTAGFFGFAKDSSDNYSATDRGNNSGMVSINDDDTNLRVGYGHGAPLANQELKKLQSSLMALSPIVESVKWDGMGMGPSSREANTCAWGFDQLLFPINEGLTPQPK